MTDLTWCYEHDESVRIATNIKEGMRLREFQKKEQDLELRRIEARLYRRDIIEMEVAKFITYFAFCTVHPWIALPPRKVGEWIISRYQSYPITPKNQIKSFFKSLLV